MFGEYTADGSWWVILFYTSCYGGWTKPHFIALWPGSCPLWTTWGDALVRACLSGSTVCLSPGLPGSVRAPALTAAAGAQPITGTSWGLPQGLSCLELTGSSSLCSARFSPWSSLVILHLFSCWPHSCSQLQLLQPDNPLQLSVQPLFCSHSGVCHPRWPPAPTIEAPHSQGRPVNLPLYLNTQSSSTWDGMSVPPVPASLRLPNSQEVAWSCWSPLAFLVLLHFSHFCLWTLFHGEDCDHFPKYCQERFFTHRFNPEIVPPLRASQWPMTRNDGESDNRPSVSIRRAPLKYCVGSNSSKPHNNLWRENCYHIHFKDK